MNEKVKRLLDQAAVKFTEIRHADTGVPIKNARDFADFLGYDVSRVTKTILLKSTNTDIFCLVVLPSDKKFDWKKLPVALSAKRLQIAAKEELANLVGYPPQGVSPIGVENIPIFMEETLLQFPTILIGSGEIAVEIEIAPQILATIIRATVLPLAQLIEKGEKD